MNLSVVLFILIVVFIKYWLLLFTSPLLMAYCWLHRRKNMANPEGEVSEIRDSGITSSSCSKKMFKRIDKRGLINIVDGYFRWMIKIISDIPSHHIRDFFYKYIFLVKMEKNSVLYYGSEIRAPWMLMIGKGSVVGDNSILDARCGGIYIGENVNIASNVSLWTGGHDYNDPYFRSMKTNRGPIYIKNRVWIGPNVTILHSVTIGEGAVIAAGAVVTKDIPPFTICGGIPAKVLAQRSIDLRYTLGGTYLHFL